MNIERTDRVYLPDSEPRCAQQEPCSKASTCARRLAPVNAAPMADFSDVMARVLGCLSFYPAGPRPKEEKAPTTRKHWNDRG